MDASPICTVNASSTLNGVNVTAGATYTIALADTAGVKSWSLSCLSTDDLLAASTISLGLTINFTTKTATGVAPAAGSALIFQSQVNGGKDANGVPSPLATCTFGIFVPTASGMRGAAFNEIAEGNAAFGWVAKYNQLARNVLSTSASAGNGLVYSAGVYAVEPDPNGSIVVGASGVKVGVLPGATVTGTLQVTGNVSLISLGFGPVANGVGVIGIGNATTAATTNPTGGGHLFAVGGALKWRGSSGTVTTIAPA